MNLKNHSKSLPNWLDYMMKSKLRAISISFHESDFEVIDANEVYDIDVVEWTKHGKGWMWMIHRGYQIAYFASLLKHEIAI